MRRLLFALTASALVTVPGCKVDSTGEAGRLTFAYRDADQLFTESLDSAIAAGTQAPIQVKAANNEPVSQVTVAEIEDPSIARIARTDGSVIVVEGLAPGTTRLRVKASGLEDRVAVTVAAADVISLKPLGSATQVFVGGTEPLSVRRSAGGQALVGEAPVDGFVAEPAAAAARVDGPDSRVQVRYDAVGDVSVGITAPTLSRTVLPLDAAARFELLTSHMDGATVDFNDALVVGAQVFDAADTEIGALQGVLQFEVADEAICEPMTGDFLGLQGVALTPLAEGDCTLTLRLGALEQTLTYAVVADADG